MHQRQTDRQIATDRYRDREKERERERDGGGGEDATDLVSPYDQCAGFMGRLRQTVHV